MGWLLSGASTKLLRIRKATSKNFKMADGTEIQQNNPLSRKLNKILETRVDNDKVATFSIFLGAICC